MKAEPNDYWFREQWLLEIVQIIIEAFDYQSKCIRVFRFY